MQQAHDTLHIRCLLTRHMNSHECTPNKPQIVPIFFSSLSLFFPFTSLTHIEQALHSPLPFSCLDNQHATSSLKILAIHSVATHKWNSRQI